MNKPKPLTVLHAAETCKGGVASWLEEALAWQAAQGGKIAVVLPSSEAGVFMRMKGVRVFGYHWGGRGALAMVRFSWALFVAFVRHRPKVVHLHSTFAGLVGRLMLAPWIITRRVRVVYTPHGWSFAMQVGPRKKAVYAAIERGLQRFAKSIVAVSEAEKALAVSYGLDARRIAVVPNAAKALMDEPTHVVGKGPVRWLFVGRFDHAKGVDVLLRAATLLAGKSWRLTIVGEPVHDTMPVIPEEIAEQVAMLGWQPRAALGPLMCAHDVLVMPSRWEGMPMLAIEALSCGIPLVASRVGGLAEVVMDGECGVLVQPDNAVALAEALRSRNAAEWRAMGKGALARHKAHFLPERMNAATWALYQD